MHDKTYASACAEWKRDFASWEAGTHSSWRAGLEYWEYAGTPYEAEWYRPWQDDEATWWQLWETVTEGTPVSPPFETRAELVEYLATYGDFWDNDGRGKERAGAFAEAGYAPSMMAVVSPGSPTKVLDSKDIPLAFKKAK